MAAKSLRFLAAALGGKLTISRSVAAGLTLSGVCTYAWKKYFRHDTENYRFSTVLYAADTRAAPERIATTQVQPQHLTNRQKRFLDFASIVYNDEVYMTPQDFLLSITQEEARGRKYRVEVTEPEVTSWLKKTPHRGKTSDKFFRDTGNHGLISFVEYLFLLCILTEPGSRFELAFNMFDLDGNKLVDKNEFSVLAKLFAVPQQLTLSSTAGDGGSQETPSSGQANELVLASGPATTLSTHFFGPKGKEVLSYEDFSRFSSNLQREVLIVEFHEFSRGLPSVSEEDFARILLRYTKLPAAKLEECLERVRARTVDPRGIKLSDFQQFCLFLNHLDDFVLMMRLYNITDRSISADEFHRAVNICIGDQISEHVIKTIFSMFDVDGDGHLSQSEFVDIMKSRLKRGLRSHLKDKQKPFMEKFKRCLKNEVANA